MLRVTGVVKNRNGLPVPGVQFSISGSTSQGGGPPQHVRAAIDDQNRRGLAGTTNAEGRFELFYLLQPNTHYWLGASLSAGRQRYSAQNAIQLLGEAVENAEVEIDCPDELTGRNVRDKKG
jgi:hypothetical protein